MRKRFRKRKKFKHLKQIIVTLIIVIVFYYIENNLTIVLYDNKLIDILWKSNNEYIYTNDNYNTYDEVINFIKANLFNSPINLLESEINYEMIKKEEISFVYKENKEPIIYIYNSHQGEKYSNKLLEDYNIVPDVLMASHMLKDKLEDIGIKSIVEENDILKYMSNNNLNHSGSYIASRHFLTKILKQYPNMELYIDIHRDSLKHDATTVNINGKECAKLLFVIGLENETYKNNLSVVNNINNIITSKYQGLSKGVLKKEGYGVNGVYNQDLNSNVILIEVGGYENSIEEVNNTLDLLANIIGEYINEKK